MYKKWIIAIFVKAKTAYTHEIVLQQYIVFIISLL